MEHKLIQEQVCLHARLLIELLRTRIFEIDNFKEYEKYDKVLKQLKHRIDSIYWQL